VVADATAKGNLVRISGATLAFLGKRPVIPVIAGMLG